ncbi:lytic transglycosylase domain-containing protein [Clostridioides difficile]|uniref:Lytic transglycosylase-like protein n=2 Tax=Clostridioides difficile TaxID=1496 RepID=A0AAX3GWJ8_CLODI|nr:lytic transglycosylase domain-containing protein [Clostridioides difficile]AVD35707.1 lytic transglycosylase domain-containing protein [Clostridioides difficile]AVD40846.1 lytic transglycosylase domain-containing protein [Clostridioides difficile]AVD44353.1 lytic transglycosylase domain-containing protein [Clostridioides difficile]AXU67457.1 transglycosylase [Clostridioides difficile]AXU89628.1 transglycosylase [Clostridioides difficile]
MNSKKVLILSIFIILFGALLMESKVIHKFLYPKKYSEYVEKYSKEFNLDENIVYSVIKAESKFNSSAVSKKEAKGLMQILDITRDWGAEELNLKNVDIFDPETNIRLGCWYLSKLYKEFGKLDLVIAAYNGGSGNVKKWLENNEYSKDGENLHDIPFKQTSKYVEKVKNNYEQYNKIYGKKGKN